MSSLTKWPRSLKLILFVGIFGMLTATAQVIQWFFIRQEFSPSITFQGLYIIVAYPLGIFCIVCGLAGARRTFSVAAVLASSLHIGATVFFNLDPALTLIRDLLAGRLDFWLRPDSTTWIYCWNSLSIAVHACLAYYLFRHELWPAGSSASSIR